MTHTTAGTGSTKTPLLRAFALVAVATLTATGCSSTPAPKTDAEVAQLIELGSGITGWSQAEMEPLAEQVCLEYETLESRGTTGKEASWAVIDAHRDTIGQEMGGFIVLATGWKCPEYVDATKLRE